MTTDATPTTDTTTDQEVTNMSTEIYVANRINIRELVDDASVCDIFHESSNRESYWLHPGYVNSDGKILMTIDQSWTMVCTHTLTSAISEAIGEELDKPLPPILEGRGYHWVNPPESYDGMTHGIVVDTTIPNATYPNLLPGAFVVRSEDGQYRLVSHQEFTWSATYHPGGSDNPPEWLTPDLPRMFSMIITAELYAELCPTPEMTAAKERIEKALAELRENQVQQAKFVLELQDAARQAKAYGWCGQVESMLSDAGIPGQYTHARGVPVTFQMNVTFRDAVTPLATQRPALIRAMASEIRRAIDPTKMDCVLSIGHFQIEPMPQTITMDGHEVSV